MFQVGSYKKNNSFEERKSESNRIRIKYHNRIPVIVEVIDLKLDKSKYLVPCDFTASQFLCIIRKRIKIMPETALFILINNSFPLATSTMSMLYKEHKDKDGFLYMVLSLENTFGTFKIRAKKEGQRRKVKKGQRKVNEV